MKARIIVASLAAWMMAGSAQADLYLVTTSEGPGFSSGEEALGVLENGIIPMFEQLAELKRKKKIIAGGLPVGSRRLVMMVEADSHEEVDNMLRDLVAWGVLKWKVTPLQPLDGRAEKERAVVRALRQAD